MKAPTCLSVLFPLWLLVGSTTALAPLRHPHGVRSLRNQHARRMAASTPTNPALAQLVQDSSEVTFATASVAQRGAAWATMGVACGAVGAGEILPAPLRMLVASVLIFANFEYVFHRFVMHSNRNEFAQYQALHVAHHVETKRDMQLEAGATSDPRHIYFSSKTTAASIGISTLGLAGANALFHLDFETCPLLGVFGGAVATSALVALFHTAYWQTIHGDIHEYYTEPGDGMPRVDALSSESPYTRWMVVNHVGHHVLRGKGNYNIVFPGPDFLWGTCWVPVAAGGAVE